MSKPKNESGAHKLGITLVIFGAALGLIALVMFGLLYWKTNTDPSSPLITFLGYYAYALAVGIVLAGLGGVLHFFSRPSSSDYSKEELLGINAETARVEEEAKNVLKEHNARNYNK